MKVFMMGCCAALVILSCISSRLADHTSAVWFALMALVARPSLGPWEADRRSEE